MHHLRLLRKQKSVQWLKWSELIFKLNDFCKSFIWILSIDWLIKQKTSASDVVVVVVVVELVVVAVDVDVVVVTYSGFAKKLKTTKTTPNYSFSLSLNSRFSLDDDNLFMNLLNHKVAGSNEKYDLRG